MGEIASGKTPCEKNSMIDFKETPFEGTIALSMQSWIGLVRDLKKENRKYKKKEKN